MVSLTESILMEFLMKYGEKGRAVLRAAFEVAEEYLSSGESIAGHFDFRGVVRKLDEIGFKYNPSQLLRIMEREYGIIETTYRTSTRRWYSFTDLDAVRKVLDNFRDEEIFDEDPEIELLKIQVSSLDLDFLRRRILKISRSNPSSPLFKEELRQVVFDELPYVVKVLKKAVKYGDLFSEFIVKATDILRITRELVSRHKRSAQLVPTGSVKLGGINEEG